MTTVFLSSKISYEAVSPLTICVFILPILPILIKFITSTEYLEAKLYIPLAVVIGVLL